MKFVERVKRALKKIKDKLIVFVVLFLVICVWGLAPLTRAYISATNKVVEFDGRRGSVVEITQEEAERQFIEEGSGQERLSEYLPYTANKGSHFAEFEPKGDETMQWILSEVKPMIDLEYRTIPFRECTGIAGSSMGGLMALYAAVHYNRWFSKAGCVSSAIGFCMRPLMSDLRKTRISPDTRVYLSWGTREAWGIRNPEEDDRHSKTYSWNKKVADHLYSEGGAVKMHCQIGGGHCEADWEQLVPTFMNFLWTE